MKKKELKRIAKELEAKLATANKKIYEQMQHIEKLNKQLDKK